MIIPDELADSTLREKFIFDHHPLLRSAWSLNWDKMVGSLDKTNLGPNLSFPSTSVGVVSEPFVGEFETVP